MTRNQQGLLLTTRYVEAQNSQNQENVLETDSSKDTNKSNDENVVAGDSPLRWKCPPKCIIIKMEILEKTKSNKYIIMEDGLLVDHRDLHKVLLDFVVDKCQPQIGAPQNRPSSIPLFAAGVKPQRIIRGNEYFIWVTHAYRL